MIALTIAIATILLLLYLGYSLIFSKKSTETNIESKEEGWSLIDLKNNKL
jgi:hypothetical protein